MVSEHIKESKKKIREKNYQFGGIFLWSIWKAPKIPNSNAHFTVIKTAFVFDKKWAKY